MKQDPGSRGIDFGLRIGMALPFSSPGLTKILEQGGKELNKGP